MHFISKFAYKLMLEERDYVRKLLPLSILVCLAAILAVAPVQADARVYESRITHEFSHTPGISTPYGIFDIDQYLTVFMTVWATEAGGSRILNNAVYKVNFVQSGEIVGRGSVHSMLNMILPEWQGDTVLIQEDIVVTFRGSGQVANYHLTFVLMQGQLVVFHEFGVPPYFYP